MYDLAVIGAGDTGTASIYVASRYTSMQRIALIEREQDIATGASSPQTNSQTLHFGDIESNFDRATTERVRDAAELVAAFLDRYGHAAMYRKGHKMLLAVGAHEVAQLNARYEAIHDLFPDIRLIGREEIAQFEPRVIAGRSPRCAIRAIISTDGYIVDFASIARAFVRLARKSSTTAVDVFRATPVTALAREEDGFRITTRRATIHARTVIVAAGAHALRFAKEMGLAAHLEILPIRGRFLQTRIPHLLRGKVYTMQHPTRPFAAIHGDPEVHDLRVTRFGPTALAVPVLERFRLKTAWDFLRTIVWSIRGLLSYVAVLCRPDLIAFIVRMAAIELIPVLGRRIFLRAAQKIVPTLRSRDLTWARGAGGIRPQLVDTRAMALSNAEGRIVGNGDIYEITPSPGASVCLGIACEDIAQVCTWVGATFDRERFLADHTRQHPRDAASP
ncbi:MAG: FAD-dependent oxidoreductase [bacterium]|nr:FAD-dependent oxidoreductase [bacterium]